MNTEAEPMSALDLFARAVALAQSTPLKAEEVVAAAPVEPEEAQA